MGEKQSDKKERTVIHVELIKDHGDNEHYYFGSIANIYEHFSTDLGITYGSLRNYGLSPDKPYKNSKCIIRKGSLLSKSGNRGRKSK